MKAKITKGKELPLDDDVIRHVPFQRLRRDGDGNVIGFLPQAFTLRPNERALSVNWLQYFDGDGLDNKIVQAVRDLRNTKTIRKDSQCGYAVGNVGQIKNCCEKHLQKVKVVFTPTESIPSHAEIQKLIRDDMSLFETLATEGFSRIVHNSGIA